MEGVNVKNSRIETVIFGNSILRDRDEEEIRGYQKALRWINESYDKIKINSQTIKKLHKLSKGDVWDSGQFKKKQVDITEITPDGKERIRFRPPDIQISKIYLDSAIKLWDELIQEKRIPSLILLIAFNFDFLCIHTFRGGNGRVSRLIILLQLYKIVFDIGKYIIVEKIIEENKERYYETLELSSLKWHESKNDIWPYVNYILFILKESYKELDTRLEKLPESKGNKSDLIIDFINNSIGKFSAEEIKYQLPVVSIELIRKILKDLQKKGKIRNINRGRNAKWEKTNGKTKKS